jgi:endonuclease YncB( thermonuclease family)
MGSCISYTSNKMQKNHQLSILSDMSYNDLNEYTYSFTKAKVIKIYDGDTFWVGAWFDNNIYRFKIRLYGIDCPELRNTKSKTSAEKSKQYLVDTVLNKIVDIKILNHKVVNNKKIEEKYGRLLANISIDGVDIATEMIRLDLGLAYYGGKKTVNT